MAPDAPGGNRKDIGPLGVYDASRPAAMRSLDARLAVRSGTPIMRGTSHEALLSKRGCAVPRVPRYAAQKCWTE
jgi:hypothetical protein